MVANFCVRNLNVAAWNLFWCDYKLLVFPTGYSLIRTCLEVAKLGELLPTIIKLAGEGLDLLVNNLVSTHVATLRKGFPTDIATVRPFAGVSPFVSLQWSNRHLTRICDLAYLEVAEL